MVATSKPGNPPLAVKVECDKLSDRDIIRFSIQNIEYFRCVVEHYQKNLKSFIKRISGLQEQEIEDILQESFIKIYINLNAYIPEMSFKSWIYQITRNQTIDYFRKNKRNYLQQELKPLATDRVSLSKSLEQENPESSFMEAELHGKLLAAIYSLKPKYREFAILRFIEGKSYDEISDITMESIGTVSSKINRAKNLLKLAFKGSALK